jgi:hypothetical protein
MSSTDPEDEAEFDVARVDVDKLLSKCPKADAPVFRCAAAAMMELHRLVNERWPPPLPEAQAALDLAVDALFQALALSLGVEASDPSARLNQLQRISGGHVVLRGACSQKTLDDATRSNQVIGYVLDATLTEGAGRYAEHLRSARATLGPRSSRKARLQSDGVREATAIVHVTASRVTGFLGHPERARSKAILDAVRDALDAYQRYAFRKEKRKTGSKWNYVAALVKLASDIEVTGFALRQGQSDHQGQIVGGRRARKRGHTK